jgi:molecular chaperone GrpE
LASSGKESCTGSLVVCLRDSADHGREDEGEPEAGQTPPQQPPPRKGGPAHEGQDRGSASTAAAVDARLARLTHELHEKDARVAELTARLEALKDPGLAMDFDRAQKLMEEQKRRSEDYLSQLRYLQADFENYRKRVDRNMRDLEDFSTSALIKRLLPVLDDLDLALSSGAPVGRDDAAGMREGVAMVRKNLASVLLGEGVRPIEALGRPFDPELHEAMARVDGAPSGEDVVVEEIRKGYILKDRVLRPSMVKVGRAARTEEKKKAEEGSGGQDDSVDGVSKE